MLLPTQIEVKLTHEIFKLTQKHVHACIQKLTDPLALIMPNPNPQLRSQVIALYKQVCTQCSANNPRQLRRTDNGIATCSLPTPLLGHVARIPGT